jgi:uncharacterized protein (TIGR02266 family)
MRVIGESSAMERRRHTRVNVEVEVDVSSGSNFFVGKTRDLSMGGLFIETPIALPIGAAVSVELRLKGKKHALATEVMWVLDADDGATVGIGVHFKNPPPKSRNAILAFMKERAPVEFEMFEPEPEDAEGTGDGAGDEVEAPRDRPSPPPLPGGKPPPLPG